MRVNKNIENFAFTPLKIPFSPLFILWRTVLSYHTVEYS